MELTISQQIIEYAKQKGYDLELVDLGKNAKNEYIKEGYIKKTAAADAKVATFDLKAKNTFLKAAGFDAVDDAIAELESDEE